MKRTISGLFDSRAQATLAVSELRAAGIDGADISMVSNNASGDYVESSATDSTSDAATGAGVGAVVGGLGGLLTGLGLMAIPGVGPVVAAGWFAATAAGAATGAVVGGATGGLVGAMTDHGIERGEAQIFAEGVRRGGTLVTVSVSDADIEIARNILKRGSVDIQSRAGAYRNDGWAGFDENAPAYTADQIRAEQSRYPRPSDL